MTRLYVMLSIVGWVWLVGLVGYVWWRSRREKQSQPHGFDVEPKD
jgi:FtsZ-interacting cell division protein ZipA